MGLQLRLGKQYLTAIAVNSGGWPSARWLSVDEKSPIARIDHEKGEQIAQARVVAC